MCSFWPPHCPAVSGQESKHSALVCRLSGARERENRGIFLSFLVCVRNCLAVYNGFILFSRLGIEPWASSITDFDSGFALEPEIRTRK